ncbi:hypothetical protein DOK67_0000683 [Enterococcus sp. DIV0212c]|uniref:SDR family NAD(P)-dependent oxidoreductase n=1 Tax=Enterococcus sp. DIV0212c TaxID=2230867 RepID=UPI001A9B99EA|nr:SDR family oxidoreductase [Enterococcus sp. DIV0212c]MBO1354666.1 SDR family oxidoreductase [Enterococcus sp. DIV0212c]
MKGIKGRNFIVVGGSNGIGKATAIELMKRKGNVVIADLDEANAMDVIRKNNKYTEKSYFYKTNITNMKDLVGLVNFVEKNMGHVHGLANIASVNIFSTDTQNFNDWIQSTQGSVAAYGILTSLVVEKLMCLDGSVVNMSSISSKIAQPNYGTYSAAKAAISALSKCQALDFSEKKIRVNTVCPGTIWTKNNEKHLKMSRTEADESKDIGGKHILNRCGDPEEVADAIVFLLSNNSSFITGTEIIVDGGYTSL